MALRDDVLKFYPQLAWALDIPDVASVLQRAVNEKWDSARLQAGLEETNWWKGTVPSARVYAEKQKTDPGSLDESIRQLDARLWDLSQSLGLNLSGQVVDSIARQAVQLGWNEQQWRDALIVQSKFGGPGNNTGTIDTTMTQLKQAASNYYVSLDDQTAYSWARQVAAGEKKAEDFTPLLMQWSKNRFAFSPEVQSAIDSGVTVQEYFSPMKQEAAKLLEVSPDSIDFINNPQFAQVLDHVDDKGVRRMMTMPEMAVHIRGMNQWKRTRQGQAAGANLAETLLGKFGKVA